VGCFRCMTLPRVAAMMMSSPEFDKRLADLARGGTRRWCEDCAEEFRDLPVGHMIVHGCKRCWKAKGYKGPVPQNAANHGVDAAKPNEHVKPPPSMELWVGDTFRHERQCRSTSKLLRASGDFRGASKELPAAHREHGRQRNTITISGVPEASLRSESTPASPENKSFGRQSLPALPGTPTTPTNDDERSQQVFGKLVKPFVQQAVERMVKELVATQLTPEQLFEKIDQNGDGELSKAEMQYALRKLGISLSPVELDAVLRAFDTDGNGTIDFEEFYTLMKVYEGRRPKTPLVEQTKICQNFVMGDRVRTHVRLLPPEKTKSLGDLVEHLDGTVVGPGTRDGTMLVKFDVLNQSYSVMPGHIHMLPARGEKTLTRTGNFRSTMRQTTL